MTTYPPPDDPESLSLIGDPVAVTVLPGDYYRWRLPLSSHPSTRWQLAFQNPLNGSGTTLPRMVNFDRGGLVLECDKASLPTWLTFIRRWIDKANAEVAAQAIEGLRVVVRFLPDCTQWYWEVRRGDEIVESSWSGQWMAYPTREEAERAGAKRVKARRAAAALKTRARITNAATSQDTPTVA
jgi:hypothetical protein